MAGRKDLKHDLAKKFELLTLQEIKNHNDSVLSTNMTLESFRNKLNTSMNNHSIKFEKVFNCIKKIESDNTDIRNDISNISRKIESQIHDLSKIETDSVEDRKEKQDFKRSVKSKFIDHYNSIQSLRNSVSENSNILHVCIKDLQKEIDDSYLKSKKNNNDIKKEILSIPSEAVAMKKDIDRSLESNKIDVSGVNENISLFREEFEYEKKKIENIYMTLSSIEKRLGI